MEDVQTSGSECGRVSASQPLRSRMHLSQIVRGWLPHAGLYVVLKVGESLNHRGEAELTPGDLQVPRRRQLDPVKVRQDGWGLVPVSDPEGGRLPGSGRYHLVTTLESKYALRRVLQASPR
jgi:hypothetical protein